MTYAQKIIQKFGGVRPMAHALKAPPSTIQSWGETGYIPARRHREVIDAGVIAGVPIGPADFFESEGQVA